MSRKEDEKREEVKINLRDVSSGRNMMAGKEVNLYNFYGSVLDLRHPADLAYYRFQLTLHQFLIHYRKLLTNMRTLVFWSSSTLILTFLADVFDLLSISFFFIALLVYFFVVGLSVFLLFIDYFSFSIRKRLFNGIDRLEQYITNEAPEMGKLVVLLSKLRNNLYPLPLIRVRKDWQKKVRLIKRLRKISRKEWKRIRKTGEVSYHEA